jgi:antitoxin ParD1/3/4
MQVTIPPDLEVFVSYKLSQGGYLDADAVVREALDALRSRDESYQKHLVDLRGDIAKGIDDLEQGRSAPLDALEILAKVRAKRQDLQPRSD